MVNKDFFDMVFEAGYIGAKGHKILCEFTGSPGVIRGGMYYSNFTKLAVFVDWKYGATSVKQIKTSYVYEFLEFLREKGFKDSTLKNYITSVRQVYAENKQLFSDDFIEPTNAGFNFIN